MERQPIVRLGMDTPWGKVDYAKAHSADFGVVGTPSHGGFRLSFKLNKRIPMHIRRTNGWYEEDCDSSIPIVHLAEVPELLAAVNTDRSAAKILADASLIYKANFDRGKRPTGRPRGTSRGCVIDHGRIFMF